MTLVVRLRGGDGARRRGRAQARSCPTAQHGGTVVGLCDGETTTEVPVAPGQALPKAQAQKVSDELMAEWRRKHPEARWDDALAQSQQQQQQPSGTAHSSAPAPAKPTTATKRRRRHSRRIRRAPTPATTSATRWCGSWRPTSSWPRATPSSTTRASSAAPSASAATCAIPTGATRIRRRYPKYQVQLQRVALLRDMINWCIENPVKGKAVRDDSRSHARARGVHPFAAAGREDRHR